MSKHILRSLSLILILCTLTMLCACSQEFVGEERAKQSGLALLRQAFGVMATDAHVEYFERAGTSVVDNADVHPGGATPNRLYIVTISDSIIGADLYYAEVDAVTGVAYYATKNEFLLAPAPAQDATDSETTDENKSSQEERVKSAASDFVMRRFQKEVALISPQGCCRGGANPSRACIGYIVTFADGALYRVGFSWPALDLNEVQVLEGE